MSKINPLLLSAFVGIIVTALLWYFSDVPSPSEDIPPVIVGAIVAVIVYGAQRGWHSLR